MLISNLKIPFRSLEKFVSQEASIIVFKILVALLMCAGCSRRRMPAPTALVFSLSHDQVFQKSTPKDVINFFKEKRFTSRANLSNPIIEVRSFKAILSKDPNVTYDIALYLFSKVLNRESCFWVYKSIKYEVSKVKKNKIFGLRELKREIFDRLVYSLYLTSVSKKTVLLTTQSSLSGVPMVFKLAKKNKKIMIWYSSNSKPIYAIDDQYREKVNFENIKAYIDEHWVWNPDDVEFLESGGVRNCHSLGAILFQEKKIMVRDANKYIVTYFDVTPFESLTNFYSYKNALALLNNVVELNNLMTEKYAGKFQLRLKPKREYSKVHSKAYVSKVQELSKHGYVEVISPGANLYEVVSESDYVLAPPFSSPAVLAKELGVKSNFIATGIVGWDIPLESSRISVEFDIDSLIRKIESDLDSKFNL